MVPPLVKDLDPTSGPICGDTKLSISGQNFGTDAADILSVQVCGSECLSTLQYESSKGIYMKTKPSHPCVGSVLVSTQTGGLSIPSKVQFRFFREGQKSEMFMSTEVSFSGSVRFRGAKEYDGEDELDHTISHRHSSEVRKSEARKSANFLLLNTVEEATQTNFPQVAATVGIPSKKEAEKNSNHQENMALQSK